MNIQQLGFCAIRRSLTVALFAISLSAAGGAYAEAKIDSGTLDALLQVKARTVQHMALNPLLVRATLRQKLRRLGLGSESPEE